MRPLFWKVISIETASPLDILGVFRVRFLEPGFQGLAALTLESVPTYVRTKTQASILAYISLIETSKIYVDMMRRGGAREEPVNSFQKKKTL